MRQEHQNSTQGKKNQHESPVMASDRQRETNSEGGRMDRKGAVDEELNREEDVRQSSKGRQAEEIQTSGSDQGHSEASRGNRSPSAKGTSRDDQDGMEQNRAQSGSRADAKRSSSKT